MNEQLSAEEREALDNLLDHIYEYGTAAEGITRLAQKLCDASRRHVEPCSISKARSTWIEVCNEAGGLLDHASQKKYIILSEEHCIRIGKALGL